MTDLRELNARINRAILYTADITDHWRTPRETLERGRGDCEDIAIVKMAEVLAIGYPVDDARLVYCTASIGRVAEAHMVLDVQGWVLDNMMPSINKWPDRPDLKPLFAFNAKRFWVQGRQMDVDPQQRLGQWRRCLARATSQGVWLG